MEIDELRKGNYVFTNGFLSDGTIVKINSIKNDIMGFTIDSPNSEFLEEEYSKLEWGSIFGVPLNKKWKELLGVNFEYPHWIKYVHEIQNWYYWTHKKTELDTSRIPMTEGDNVKENCLEELLRAF